MKARLPRFSPIARIALGLISLVATLLLVVDITLELVPTEVEVQRRIRQSTSERLAVQIASQIQLQQWDGLKATLRGALARERDILSLAVRQQDGRLLVQAGDHLRYWEPPPNGLSTLTHVRVPLLDDRSHWGDVEISYAPVAPQTLTAWLRQPLVALFFIIVPVGFLAFYLYIRRSLQYLDPTAAIPDRVRTAFDTLNEGVAVIDRDGRIMLSNKAFRRLHPQAAQDLVGKPLSEQDWLTGHGAAQPQPWAQAMETNAPVTGQPISITQPDQSVSRLIVNAAPVQDGGGRLRGCMVSFHDQTELHHANEQMRDALIKLEASRKQVEEQNVELVRLATRDPLTGCYNRRAFFSAAEPLLDQIRLHGRQLCCVMADIDHFKRVNDTYGHAVGDQVIVAVARAMSAGLRTNDLLCRYGGEEFCILLPDTTPEQALDITERLRTDIEQNAGPSVRSIEGLRFTSSFGVASFSPDLTSISELIELADYALYSSKHNGRNRVTLWTEDMQLMDEAALNNAHEAQAADRT
jgi:diguanylate cyclase (GGDEF)-like protein/PAS domain S-box-containing protein